MKYLFIAQTAERWGISTRRIRIFCGEGRVPGAIRICTVWGIPEDAEKPADARKELAMESESMTFFEFIGKHIQEFSLLVSAISTLIAAITAIAAFIANHQNKKQYKDSIRPQLSMSLVEFDSILYLRIKNTGKTAAKNIEIRIAGIKNNGNSNNLYLDDLFKREFELYPEEVVQGKVAICGRNIAQSVFPQVEVSASYRVDGARKITTYKRTVTYLSAYTEKISADINLDARQIEDSLKSMARASVRTANYLDGRQAASFDGLDILAGCSLKTDLLDVLHKEPETVLSRSETIEDALNRNKEENSHANT